MNFMKFEKAMSFHFSDVFLSILSDQLTDLCKEEFACNSTNYQELVDECTGPGNY